MILRDYQNEAVWSAFRYLDTTLGNGVIAMPTGTGKSLVIAEILRQIFTYWPSRRIMMLTHVKELIEQNAEELLKLWATAPLGIYSAGLKQRDVILPIVFGGIASVNKKPQIFGHRDLLLIDECHLLSPDDDTMYQKTIKALREINPHLRVMGLSATPYRLKQGMITDGGIFTDICFDITDVASFNRLIAEGYLCQLIPKRTQTTIDVSNVGIVGGEYNQRQLEEAVDIDAVTFAACKEMVEYGQQRNSWLVFAAGVANAEHVASMLQSFGVAALASHSKLSDEENKRRIKAFKSGEIRALVNNNKYTTGFNHPAIDLIGMLRPTTSPGLWVQMLGRGTRPSPDTGKENCLVLDFAGNTKRLGPINDPVIPRRPGKGTGDPPVKLCEHCGTYNHTLARYCVGCGAEFEFRTKLFKQASEMEVIKSDAPIVEIYDVKRVIYSLHEKKNSDGVLISPPSMKVSYFCGLQMFNEWVCLEHPGGISKRARDWWRQRHREEPPATTYEALRRHSELRVPARIRVHTNKRYPEILGWEF
jgi:DNA repair protein RadD